MVHHDRHSQHRMQVIKRDGTRQPVSFDKVMSRIQILCDQEPILDVDASIVAQQTISRIFDGVHTSQLDELAADWCANMNITHPDYGNLASRICVSNLQKNCDWTFTEAMHLLYNNVVYEERYPLVSEELVRFVDKHAGILNATIVPTRDYLLDYFGFKTLEYGYLMRTGDRIIETPQFMWMRVACGIHAASDDIDAAIETYNYMSLKHFTHATPTLFNAGTPHPQCSSCYLLGTGDCIEAGKGMYKTIADCAAIQKWAGGIGIHISNIRAKGSRIRGTNGKSDGIMPMLRVYNSVAQHVNQGGKRNGSIAVYLEPWHAEIFDFLDARKPHGDLKSKAMDLFYALMIPDIFMRRVVAAMRIMGEAATTGKPIVMADHEELWWYLMCPDECRDLNTCYGVEFECKYLDYIARGKYRERVEILKLFDAICDAQIETGTPYMLYKDHINHKSNQQNIGPICSSNLCAEIVEYSTADSYAVCNLTSTSLPSIVLKDPDSGRAYIDHYLLGRLIRCQTINLNKIIDINYYPTPETRTNNLAYRPIGMGIQGLSDMFALLDVPFDSPVARIYNREVTETMYYWFLRTSCDLAKRDGAYSAFHGSPASRGILQFDMWGVTPSNRWDWDTLRTDIIQHGLRNSLGIAMMPTASTSQILGNSECFEPYKAVVYNRRTIAGNFIVINQHLVRELIDLDLWSITMKDRIIAAEGSITDIAEIPARIRDKYKTVWEIKQRSLIEMAADRGAFVDQSQSLNLFLGEPNKKVLRSMHILGWQLGLKTGQYYLRTRAAKEALKFNLDAKYVLDNEKKNETTIENKECVMCSA